MVETYYGPKPDRVRVEHLDGRTHVWLVRDAVADTVDNGPDRDPVEVYTGKLLRFTLWGTLSAEDAEAHFDELWAQHENDGMSAAERIGEVEKTTADNSSQIETLMQGVAELGDMIATQQGGDA